MLVSKWGNSLAIRIPVAVAEVLGLKEGDDIEVTTTDGRALKIARAPDREAAMARLREFRGRLPEGWKFDRDEANER